MGRFTRRIIQKLELLRFGKTIKKDRLLLLKLKIKSKSSTLDSIKTSCNKSLESFKNFIFRSDFFESMLKLSYPDSRCFKTRGKGNFISQDVPDYLEAMNDAMSSFFIVNTGLINSAQLLWNKAKVEEKAIKEATKSALKENFVSLELKNTDVEVKKKMHEQSIIDLDKNISSLNKRFNKSSMELMETYLAKKLKILEAFVNHVKDQQEDLKTALSAVHESTKPDSVCTICLDNTSAATSLPCTHRFCFDCLVGYIGTTESIDLQCPNCRYIFTQNDINENSSSGRILKQLINAHDKKMTTSSPPSFNQEWSMHFDNVESGVYLWSFVE